MADSLAQLLNAYEVAENESGIVARLEAADDLAEGVRTLLNLLRP